MLMSLRPEVCLTKGSIRTGILIESTQIYDAHLSASLQHFSPHRDRIYDILMISPIHFDSELPFTLLHIYIFPPPPQFWLPYFFKEYLDLEAHPISLNRKKKKKKRFLLLWFSMGIMRIPVGTQTNLSKSGWVRKHIVIHILYFHQYY